ncbi:outer membrane lipoprotein-sorting protein [Rhodobacteraceae bacterium NNCM2]|nr:outer membrane lipoprotein-sorting protein [Coraliihabitans acroporae]
MRHQPIARSVAQYIADFIVRFRWLWVFLSIALVGISVVHVDRVYPLNPSARIFFAEENPDRQALDRFEATFVRDENLMIILDLEDNTVFTPETIRMIGELTEKAWMLPYVRRVDSITNFQHSEGDGDQMVVRDLVPDPANATQAEIDAAKEIALSRIELLNSMISPGADTTMVLVRFELPRVDPRRENPEIVEEARLLKQQIEADYPNATLRLTGGVMINNTFATSGQEDAMQLMGPMFAAILLIVGVALGSFLATVSVLIVIVLSAACGLGVLGWMGVALNTVTVLAPLYIMTLAVASAVHILAAARQHMVETADRREWMRRALADHMGAITIACTTTAIGFLTLNFSISPPFRELGNVVAGGVLASLFFSLTLLPALVTLLPIQRRLKPAFSNRMMAHLGEFVVRWNRVILPAMMVVVVASVWGMTRLKLEDDFIRYFDERFDFRLDTDFTEDRLTGVNLLEFPLPSGAAQGINDPAYLKEVSDFTDWLRAQPEVTSVATLTDTLKRLNMNMHGDAAEAYRLPATREEASQYLLLYALSLGYGLDLTDQVDIDRSILRVTVRMRNVTTATMRDLSLRAGYWLEDNAPIIQAAWDDSNPGLHMVTPTGIVHVFNLISYRDVRAMLVGSTIAIFAISAIIMIALQSVRIGLVSLIPNLVPAFMAFGLWGYGVGSVTLAIAVVLAATMGIVVDDTVHFLSKYSRARKDGMSAEDAVRSTFRSVGMALFVTTVGLVAGFSILAQSGFAVSGDLARLTAITISLALAADFLLLPALLIWLDRRRTSMKTAAAASILLVAAVLLLGKTSEASAVGASQKGLEITQEADRRDTGFGSYAVMGEMILRDRQGRESHREFRSMVRERPDQNIGDLSVIIFERPRDIKGTSLLTHANVEPTDDDQWLYLPAVKRVKRISSSNRTGKFVSSEFSFEDLGSQEVNDYTYEHLRDEACPTDPSLSCFVVEGRPVNPKSGYAKRVSWMDQDEYRLQRVEFFNRRGDLEKVLTFEGYNQYLGKYWRPAAMHMVNVQTGKETDLLWSDYEFGVDLPESDFDKSRLKLLAR